MQLIVFNADKLHENEGYPLSSLFLRFLRFPKAECASPAGGGAKGREVGGGRGQERGGTAAGWGASSDGTEDRRKPRKAG
jgi:hypothetical protein